MKDKCIALASANKDMVADSIIAKELASGALTEETQDARKEELVAKSMKELSELQKEVEAGDARAPRTPAQVTSPVKVDDNNDGNGIADTNNKETSDNNADAKKTVDDFAKDIVGKLFK